MKRPRDLDQLLKDAFEPNHVDRALTHFDAMVGCLQRGQWEQSIAKGGKFIEATLKALAVLVGSTAPTSGREFKADKIITELSGLPQSSFPDSVRLTIPRACRFAYDVASNRGARHDPGEIDPNEMDANAVMSTCSWILAEMLRYSQKGSLDNAAAADLVGALTERKYPFLEEIDGRVYFNLDAASARDVAILTLWHRHPKRQSKEEIISSVMRHGHSRKNAQVALSRLRGLVDEDQTGSLRLLQWGLHQAEQLIKA